MQIIAPAEKSVGKDGRSCFFRIFAPDSFIRDDNHVLIPSTTNNRYLKLRGSGTDCPLSLNMKAVHGLTALILNNYLSSGVLEIDRINNRIIKGRMSETKGDEMIDSAISEIHALEDVRQTLIYNNSVINNKLAYLANPLFYEEQVINATNDDELKALVNKTTSFSGG